MLHVLKSYCKTLLIVAVACLGILKSSDAMATHIAGGQIVYRNLGNRTIEYTFIGYRDEEGVLFGNGLFDFGDGEFFGDEDGEVFDWEIVSLENGIERWEFKLVHVYNGFASYLVSYAEDFRTANVVNTDNSVTTSFYVDAQIVLDPIFRNSSPRPLFPPGFQAYTGHTFVSSFSMVDDDQDSLSYSLVVPRQSQGLALPGYHFPAEAEGDNSETNGNFSVDRLSGELTWDAPEVAGLYVFAVRVEEWRTLNGSKFMIGYTVLDYLVQVEDEDPPLIWVTPETSCQSSNESYESQVVISNTSMQDMSIQVESGIQGITFNGYSESEWNERFTGLNVTDESIMITIRLEAQDLISLEGLQSVFIELRRRDDENLSRVIRFPISVSFGVDCSSDELLVLGLNPEANQNILLVDPTTIQIINSSQEQLNLSILDLYGRKLFGQEINKEFKEETVNFSFEKGKVYLLVLQSKSRIMTKKFILTN